MLKQADLKPGPYRTLQQKAVQTEVEPFNEPFDNLCLFTVDDYAAFVDALDLEGLPYDVQSHRPSGAQLLDQLRSST